MKSGIYPLPVLVALGSAALVWSQATAILTGTITDPTGAVIIDAPVNAKNLNTGLERQAKSDPQGRYRLVNLPPGPYEVRVDMPGFKRALQQVTLGTQTVELPFVLEIGNITQTIEITAPSPALMTSSSSISMSTSGRRGKTRPPAAPPNTEDYGPALQEDAYADARRKPLSTFSIDVDTAAYSQVRRFLSTGQMPPPDAVRVEELLNYFPYSYPDPAAGHPFSVTTSLVPCPWNKKHHIAHIGLRSQPILAADMPPASLTFLIDVSGSMAAPNKLPLLVKSFSLLVQQLRPQDRVAITVYAGAAGLVLSPTSGAEKEKIQAALDRLHAGGSTAGAAGLRLAYQTARHHFLKNGNNRVILATDGDFNVGVSSDAELQRLIERERQHGIFLTVLGYGMGNVKDGKMEMLARHGNGNYAYIDNLLEARRALVEQLGATLVTVAKDVKLQVEFNPARVKGYRLIGYENRRLRDEDFKDDRQDAGDLGAGHTVTALYEIIPAGSKEKLPAVDPLKYQQPSPSPAQHAAELLTVKLRYKQPQAKSSTEFAEVLSGSLREPHPDLRFALAVAEFGLLLRNSRFKADSSFDRAAANAAAALGPDLDGRRAEFLLLVKQAKALAASPLAQR